MKKRLGIFAFYDSSGIVERYVERVLESILTELEELILVVNGNITEQGLEKVKKYSKTVVKRENIGFDAGAYKDILSELYEKNEIERFDEILFLNNTFFAPVFPWRDVFEKMEEEEADVWGLTTHPGGKDFGYHIQTYFLVCTKNVFLSEEYKRFWEKLQYPETFSEAVKNFEVAFSQEMMMAGFKLSSYMKACGMDALMEDGKNTYIYKAKELLEQLHLPVLKRKVVDMKYNPVMEEIYRFIREETEYDISLIADHIQRLDCEGKNLFDTVRLEEFVNIHSDIYIYGCGQYGKTVANYLEGRGLGYSGFLVSQMEDAFPGNVRLYTEFELKKEDGVILALGKRAFEEVYPTINKDFGEGQLFLLNY